MRLNLLTVCFPSLLASLLFAGGSFQPTCLVRPDHLQLRLPHHGFKWAEGEQSSGGCKGVPAKKWLRQGSGSFNLFVSGDGPSGSGRYWKVTIGVAKSKESKPTRGICLVTSTVGWRTLQQWKKAPLAWLEDLDHDGKAEVIVWNSFPIREEASMAEYGLMAWVYRIESENSLALDWNLSRKMAAEIAETYRSPLDSKATYSRPLRAEAAEALERFVDKRCSLQATGNGLAYLFGRVRNAMVLMSGV